MENTEKQFILIRTPRTNEQGDRTPVTVKMVKRAETDLTGYSFLQSFEHYDEWVPTVELDLYKKVFEITD